MQSNLPRPVSYRFLFVLKGVICKGSSPFRFEIVVEPPKCLRNWWQEISIYRSASFILMEKLKMLKGLLKSWYQDAFGNLIVNRTEALRLINHWDCGE